MILLLAIGLSLVFNQTLRGGDFLRFLASTLPWVLLVYAMGLLIDAFMSRKLAQRILLSIEKLTNNEADAPYEEFFPIIQRIRAQEAFIVQERMERESSVLAMKSILGSMKEGAALLDQGGNILFLNSNAEKYLSTNRNVIGKNIIEVTRQLKIHEGVKKALHGEGHEWIQTDSETSVQLFCSPVIGYGAIILWLDVTHRMRADQMRMEFTANVSHELKTPLTNISGYAECLAAGLVKEADQASFIQKIRDESARMLLCIDDLLLLSRLNETEKAIEMKDVPLQPVLLCCVKNISKAVEIKKISVALTCDELITVFGNERMVEELFGNLLDNAVKYSKENGQIEIIARIDSAKGCVSVSVRDTGIGIPAEYHARVFERFFRVDKSRSRKTGGTGLGLSIVKHIVDIHHGKISLQSEEEKGTTMVVALPTGVLRQLQ